jgi:membrane-associated phospholipid phosphatase
LQLNNYSFTYTDYPVDRINFTPSKASERLQPPETRNTIKMSLLITSELPPLLQQFHELDIQLLRGLYENRNPLFDSTFIVITDSAAALAFGIPAIFLIHGLIVKNKLQWRNALTVIIAVAIAAIVANIIKFSLDTPRPYEIYPFIEKLSSGGSPSFPSGHTTDAFAFAVAAGLVYSKWYILLPGLIWATLVGISRMWLGVHYPSDVIAGAILGTACALLYFWLDKKYRARAQQNL